MDLLSFLRKKKIIFFDIEVDPSSDRVVDFGAINDDGDKVHTDSFLDFARFFRGFSFVCGHNILNHDLKYVGDSIKQYSPYYIPIDTLYLSPLLFPEKPYHKLLKDDKLQVDEINNPLNDSIKAQELFYDELNAFYELSDSMQQIYCGLLSNDPMFSGFFKYIGMSFNGDLRYVIRSAFYGKICDNSDLDLLINRMPVELAFALAIINVGDKKSLTPPWVYKNYPAVTNALRLLRSVPCDPGCEYCRKTHDPVKRLKNIFGYDSFRTYEGEPLQENAVKAAINGKPLIAVFPTGGGKSLTFQLPALMEGESVQGLTVVISPLQSLMKDQVDNLESRGIPDAVTINGLLDPIARRDAIQRVENGMASLLYISPESLRSKSIERLLMSRNVVRFVIDEAHCFSAWGHDFRVDYLYIGDFIKSYQEQKHLSYSIPVSCFTATAKQKVISDICEYFREKLGLELQLFATAATRKNLSYSVLYRENDEDKYSTLRSLIQSENCPTIVYVSRVKRTGEIARKLTEDGIPSKPYNGKMDSTEKIEIQNSFINGDIQVIVATSAFGMGVDKKDVQLVIHYDISDSLENYVQEAGRAGRDESLDAKCYVLFNDNDLDKHFILLNQTKLSISEIQQVWRAIKELTKQRPFVSCSPLEIARQAGWDDSSSDIETRVKTAITALENAGYIKRGKNVPHVYADSILAKTAIEANQIIDSSVLFSKDNAELAKRAVNYLISRRATYEMTGSDAESRVDYIADHLGVTTWEIVNVVNLMREEGLLADHMDLVAHISASDSENRSERILNRFLVLEEFFINNADVENDFNYKEINDAAIISGIKNATVKDLKTITYYWIISGILRRHYDDDKERYYYEKAANTNAQRSKYINRAELSQFIVSYLYELRDRTHTSNDGSSLVEFSVKSIQQAFNNRPSILPEKYEASTSDVQDALLYLSKIRAITMDGGFLVSYNAMQITRLETNNLIQYKKDDYKDLDEFYKQRIQQIHIVGEYAHLMAQDKVQALQFVSDYFQMDYKAFLAKYFRGNRLGEINRNITPEKYNTLFGDLSEAQRMIIDDDKSKYIVVAAGPGSGKTRVLVHKLASLLMLEDVKHEQLLMLTFSRAAATEFKSRLAALIGSAAHFVEINTFHSYCFDLLGRIGNLEESDDVVRSATEKILDGSVEPGRITKTVLVIDEAQDMDENEFGLVRALMETNENMRVIAVGDDDQNIYEFRGSDSSNFKKLIDDYGAKRYELLDNYRSVKNIVELSNVFASSISNRMKNSEIRSVTDTSGSTSIIKYRTRYIEAPIVNWLRSHVMEGTCAILTSTNDEAFRVLGLLMKYGIPAKLIQSNDGFVLYNLAEFRYFIKQINELSVSPTIDDECWEQAIHKLSEMYSSSTALPLVMRILDKFASVNSETKYRSDLVDFIRESKAEDFLDTSADSIVVSTIHKSKGKEFDTVHILLDHYPIDSDEKKRVLYVGMTRARKSLFIHTNTDDFDRLSNHVSETMMDNTDYSAGEELLIQLSYKDVFLDYFKDNKRIILSRRSGDALLFDGDGLKLPEEQIPIVKFSKQFKTKLSSLFKKGYTVTKAEIRYIVAWKGKEDTEESAIILPNLYLMKP